MRRLIEKFVQYPIYANLIIAVFIFAGGIGLMSMKKSFFPEVESRYISISVYYPGASPVEMEEGVTSRIEEAIRGLIGIKEITSTSSENSARVNIETNGEYPIDEILMEVKNAVDGVSSLPSAAERPIVAKNRSRAPALRMDVVPEKGVVMDLMTLKEHAQRIEEDFYSSGVMSLIELSGYPQPEISVEVNEEQLLRYNISFEDISAAIQRNNQDVSAGQIKSDDEELLIRLRSRSTNPDKIGNIVLFGQSDGSFIRIRDIAEVKKKFADAVNKSWVNGKESVSINVEKLPSEDLEEITKFARAYMKEFNDADHGVKLDMSRAYIDILQSRLKLLAKNGLIGLILIITGLSLFLSVRLSLWVSFGIPFSFLGMFIAAAAMGLSINMMSLFGMILVVGILVDDGIVIAENVYLHFERGKRPMLAAVDGTMEVLPAVITSITTTIIAFIPLLFLAGTRMEMMLDMAIVVILSLLFSLAEVFFVLPAHLSNPKVLSRRSLKAKNKGIKKYFENAIVWLRDRVYHYLLLWLIRWRHIVIGIPVGLILITLGLYLGGHIKNTFYPSVDFDRFQVNVAFTPGDGEAQTLKYLRNFETAIWQVNDEMVKELGMDENLISRVSTNLGSARTIQETGSHAGSISVYPIDLEGYDITGFEIANRVRKKIGPIPEALKFTVGGRNRWGSPISVGLMSKNLGELEEAKQYLMGRLTELPALKDITETLSLGKQEVRLNLKPKAYFLKLDESTIARQLRSGFYGLQAQRLQEGRDELRIWVRYPKNNRATLGQMEKMKIKTPQGEFPLNELASYHFERGPVAINRFNGSREIRVEAETIDPFAPIPEIIEQIEVEIMPELLALYPGIRYIYQGQQRSSQEAMVKIKRYFLLAFIVILFIMIIHFRSVDQPLIIIAMIPLSMLGVFWGHGIHDKPLSLMSLFGMVALTGVIINDAIVFLAKYDGLLLEGRKVADAIVEAGKVRLRPIILTSITTSVGLFPIILEKSVQAQFLIPMAISLAYGVAIGTIFILIFFPVLIMLLNDFRVFRRKIWTGIRPTREEMETVIILRKRELRFEHGPSEEEEKERENMKNNKLKMKPLLYTFILIFLGSTSSLIAQEKLLSLSEAIDKTLSNNYGIVISAYGEDAAELNNSWGNAGRYPSVGFDLNSQNNIRYSDGSETSNNNLIADLNIGWKIFDGFKVKITKEKLEKLEELSQGQSAVVIENTIQDLILAYYYVLLQAENLKVIENLMSLSKDRFDYETARFEYGGAVSVNVLLAKNVWLNDKTAYLSQELRLKEAYRTLNFIMSEKDNPKWLLSSDFAADSADFVLSTLIDKMLSSNYVLKNQYINQSLKEQDRKLRESDLFPDLGLSAGISNSNTRMQPAGLDPTTTQSFTPYGNLSFSYDIFTGGIRKTAISVAKINSEISAIQTEEMVHSLQNQMLSLYDYHLLRKELLALANENLETAEINLGIAEKKYRNGSLTSFEFRDIQLIHLNASLGKLAAIYDLIFNETEITRITGGFLKSDSE